MHKNNAVVCLSGGMDSTVLLYHAKRHHDNVLALSFNYQQRHLRELEFAKYHTQKLGIEHKILDISFFKEIAHTSSLTNSDIPVDNVKNMVGEAQPVQYVPCRNLMLLSICAAAAESFNANSVYHGAAQADSIAGYWDGASTFIDALNNVLLLNRKNKIQVVTPLLDMSKKNIIEYGLSLDVDFSKTLTCYNGKEIACGTCPSCSLRLMGWIQAQKIDPILYQKEINWVNFGCNSLIKE